MTVRRLYGWTSASRTITPLWLDGEGVSPRATALATTLDSVESLGLRPDDYGVVALTAALQAASPPQSQNATAATFAHADLILTSSFVSLTDDLLTGRVDPRDVEPTWHIAPGAFDVGARITAALDSVRAGQAIREVLAGLRPDYGSYGALIQALARYREFGHDGGWPTLPNDPAPRPGGAGSIVPALRRRLAAEGYLPSISGAIRSTRSSPLPSASFNAGTGWLSTASSGRVAARRSTSRRRAECVRSRQTSSGFVGFRRILATDSWS